jgi:1,4-dihydroxy-2-naphthoate octaprenyltransferase
LTQFWKLIRAKTLGASIGPVVIAYIFSLRADNQPNWLIFGLTVIMAASLQVEANLADDYFDEHLHFKSAVLAACVASVAGTVVIILTHSYFLFPLGILCHLSLLFYSGGDKPLGNQPWGDVLCFFFFGPVAGCGSYYLFSKGFSVTLLIVSCVCGLLSVLLLEFNHLRDLVKDQSIKRVNLTNLAISLLTKFQPDFNRQRLASSGAVGFNIVILIIWLMPILVWIIFR